MPSRVRVAREAAGPGLRAHGRRQPGLRAGPGGRVRAAASRTSTSAGSRSPAAGRTTAAGCATCATRPGIPVCAGQSETTLDGHPRPDRRRRHRRLQLRRLVGRRPDDLAQGSRARRRVRRRARPPRGAADRVAPAGERARPHVRRVLRRGARPVLLAALRHVDADRATAGYTCPSVPASASSSTGTTCERHTVATRSTDRSTLA